MQLATELELSLAGWHCNISLHCHIAQIGPKMHISLQKGREIRLLKSYFFFSLAFNITVTGQSGIVSKEISVFG